MCECECACVNVWFQIIKTDAIYHITCTTHKYTYGFHTVNKRSEANEAQKQGRRRQRHNC